MKKLTIGFLILATTILAQARVMKMWSYQELHERADLVVIARHISTTNTTEQATLPDISPSPHVIGMSSLFDVELVLKGDKGLKQLTLHHYKLAPLPPNTMIVNGPNLVSFETDHYSTRYLLFLHLEPDGRYAPVSGQTDPDRVSILRLDENAL